MQTERAMAPTIDPDDEKLSPEELSAHLAGLADAEAGCIVVDGDLERELAKLTNEDPEA